MDPLFTLILSVFFSAFWGASAAHKFVKLAWFRGVLQDYHLFPKSLIKALSIGVPLMELSIAVSLFVLPQIAVLLSAALLTLYAVLLIFTSLRGLTLKDCGCNWGGSSTQYQMSPSLSAGRNIVLIILSLVILLPNSERPLTVLDWTNAAFAVVIFGLFIVVGAKLLANYFNMKASGYV